MQGFGFTARLPRGLMVYTDHARGCVMSKGF